MNENPAGKSAKFNAADFLSSYEKNYAGNLLKFKLTKFNAAVFISGYYSSIFIAKLHIQELEKRFEV